MQDLYRIYFQLLIFDSELLISSGQFACLLKFLYFCSLIMLYKAMTTTTCDETDVIPAVIGLEFDAEGNPLDVITVEEWFDELDNKLINHFGEDFRILLNQSRIKDRLSPL